MDKEITFWTDGDYIAKGGIYVRNNLKDFIKQLIESGLEPVGIKVDLDSYNLEIIVKEK
jgi:hypothetical protein